MGLGCCGGLGLGQPAGGGDETTSSWDQSEAGYSARRSRR
jgi:hypothetical protein